MINDDINNDYYDPLTKELYNFIQYRILSILGKDKTKFIIHQMQYNLYQKQGIIKGHCDWMGWFIMVIMIKLFKHCSLHFGLKGGHCNEFVINTSYYFPLMIGEIFEMQQWSFSHYFHSISSWMHEEVAMTMILRQFSKQIQFYKSPQFNYLRKTKKDLTVQKLKQAKAIKLTPIQVKEIRQQMIKDSKKNYNQYMNYNQNNNNNHNNNNKNNYY